MLKRYVYMEGFTNLTGSEEELSINIEGVIKDKFDRPIETKTTSDGQKSIRCKAWDGEREYRVIDLVAIQFKNLRIPESDYDKVIAFVIDGDPNNTHASNVGYRFKGGKLEVKAYPGFYYVPGLTSIAIAFDGQMISSKTGRILKQQIYGPNNKKSKGGYVRSVGRFQDKKLCTMLRHRALCLVFKEYPDNADDLDVNHINGVPGDDRLDNLEWATRSKNLFHAHRTGLINLSEPVLTRDIVSGVVTEYYSIRECARHFNTDAAAICNRLQPSKFGKVYKEGSQIKLKSDKRPWIEITDPEKEIQNSQLSYEIEARNHITGECAIFKSIAEAGKFIGQSAMRGFFHDSRQPLFQSGWQFKKLTEEWKEIQNVDEILYKLQKEVMARDEATGSIVIADNCKQMAKVLSFNSDNIRSAAMTRGNKVYRNHRFRLGISTEPWPSLK